MKKSNIIKEEELVDTGGTSFSLQGPLFLETAGRCTEDKPMNGWRGVVGRTSFVVVNRVPIRDVCKRRTTNLKRMVTS